MGIKKALVPLAEFLEENKEKKVKSVLDQIIAMISTKGRASGDGTGSVSTFIKDHNGTTVAVLDYYFKRWMPLVGELAVEFGAKASSASGFSSMSKSGVSHWTKQQRTAKTAIADILKQVEAGELAPSGISDAKAAIEEDRKVIVATDDGFAERDEVVAYLEEMGVDLTPVEKPENSAKAEASAED